MYPLTIILTIAVCVLSLAPIGRVEIASDVPFADKWTHMVMYAALTAAVFADTWRARLPLTRLRAVALLLCPIALGALMEVMQAYLTTYRSGEWLDLMADALGAAVAWCTGIAVMRRACRSTR